MPRPSFERKPPRIFTQLAEPLTQLYERLNAAGILHPIKAKSVDTSAKWYDPKKWCAYHSGVAGHDTENCLTLKNKVQDLIDNKVIPLVETLPSVNNLQPNYKE